WAERAPEIVGTMRQWAARYEMVLVGSLPVMENGVVYNTSHAIDSTGEIAGSYRKIHLFSLHGEDRHFGRGESPVLCDTSVGRIGLMICYDLRFPELARRLALDGAEILCVSALWPAPRVEHWSLLLRGRALENQLFAIGCNGCGRDGKMVLGGASAVISPTGIALAEAARSEGAALAELKPDDIVEFRKHIPCFEDRCPEAYERD
ncbi:MAG: nitrilase-related carbon-nitrogen hydrolase, partial [Acidobacteriota bacterium]